MKCGFHRTETQQTSLAGVALQHRYLKDGHDVVYQGLQGQILIHQGVTLLALCEIMKKMTSLKCSMSFKGLTLGGYDKKRGFSFRRSSGKRQQSLDEWDDIFDANVKR